MDSTSYVFQEFLLLNGNIIFKIGNKLYKVFSVNKNDKEFYL